MAERSIGPGHDREGARHFYWQRLTAVGNIFLVVLLVWLVLSLASAPYEAARAALGRPFPGVPFAVLIVGGVFHMRLGMQVIIEDYARGAARTFLLLLNRFLTILIVALCVFSIVKIMTGA